MSGYISKDFIHRGCGLVLSPELVWNSVPYSVQKNVKKAEKNNVKVIKVSGTKSDLEILRNMWYDTNDLNLPNQINANEYMFIAYNSQDIPIGTVILLPVNNHLFLNNLAGNSKGKSLRVQDYLLWYCVNYFKDSQFKYIDVGVSFRQNLYNFFKKWQTVSYPVIFNVPSIKLDISLYPFNSNNYKSDISLQNIEKTKEILSNLLDKREFTFIPNLNEAQKIFNILNIDFEENSYNFINIQSEKPFVIDLSKVFSVQFGVLIVNLNLDDKTIWNDFKALDIFKRDLVFSSICEELKEFDLIISKRKNNIEIFNNFFSLEDIFYIEQNEMIPSAYYFESEFNNRFHNRLNDFSIPHYYNEKNNIIGLSIHQNISFYQIEYMYAIFRGVLNLCSEWIPTNHYSDLS